MSEERLSGGVHACLTSDPAPSFGAAIREYGRRFREFPDELKIDAYGWMCAFNGIWSAAKCGCCPHKVRELHWMGVKISPSHEENHNEYRVIGKSGQVRVSYF